MTPADLTARGVRVKPLAWEDLGAKGNFSRAKSPLFGTIRVENYGDCFTVAYSVPGFSDTFTPGEFPSIEAAKAAAQADYEARICAALTTGENND